MKIPDKPKGWTKKMTLHINYGEDGGRGEYTIKDETGKKMPFSWVYDTRKEVNKQGYVHPDCEDIMTWEELRKFMEEKDD